MNTGVVMADGAEHVTQLQPQQQKDQAVEQVGQHAPDLARVAPAVG